MPREISDNYFVFAAYPTDFIEEGAIDETTTVKLGDTIIGIKLEDNPFLVVTE